MSKQIITPEEVSECLSNLITERTDKYFRQKIRDEDWFKPKYESLVADLTFKRNDLRDLIKNASEHQNLARATYFNAQLELINELLLWNGVDDEEN
jgi:hypothetical protein